MSKFVRRHSMAVAAAATLLVMLVAFAVTMGIQARRVTRERDRANREAAAAREVANFLTGLFRVSDPEEGRGATLTAREILDNGAHDIDQNLRGQPELQGRVQTTIGHVYTNLGQYAAAEPLLRQAVETLRRTSGNNSLQTLNATHELANLHWFQERYGEAEPLYLAVVQGRTLVQGAEHRDTLRAKYDLASLYMAGERWDEADRLSQATIATQRRVFGETDTDTIASMGNLAHMYFVQRRYAEALPIAIRVMDVRTSTLGDEAPATATAIHNVATNYDALKRFNEAESLYLRALASKRRTLGDVHPATLTTLTRLSSMYIALGRYPEAEALLRGAYTTLPEQHQQSRSRVARVLLSLYEAAGQLGKAAELRAKMPREAATKTAAR
jgi:non-specific serine/threonine protein kinase/serine/threonine-protein kinase